MKLSSKRKGKRKTQISHKQVRAYIDSFFPYYRFALGAILCAAGFAGYPADYLKNELNPAELVAEIGGQKGDDLKVEFCAIELPPDMDSREIKSTNPAH